MKRKTVAIVLSIMLAISALGGCGSSTSANVETEKTQESRTDGRPCSDYLCKITGFNNRIKCFCKNGGQYI